MAPYHTQVSHTEAKASFQPAGLTAYNKAVATHSSLPYPDMYPRLEDDGNLAWYTYEGARTQPQFVGSKQVTPSLSRSMRRSEAMQRISGENALDLTAAELCARACVNYNRYRCQRAEVDRSMGDFYCRGDGGYHDLPVDLRFK